MCMHVHSRLNGSLDVSTHMCTGGLDVSTKQ